MESVKSQKCSFCQQVNNKNCCIWRLYYRLYKKQDWESDTFKEFIQENT